MKALLKCQDCKKINWLIGLGFVYSETIWRVCKNIWVPPDVLWWSVLVSCLVSPLSLCVSSVTVWSSSCSHHPELVVTPEYTHDDDGAMMLMMTLVQWWLLTMVSDLNNNDCDDVWLHHDEVHHLASDHDDAALDHLTKCQLHHHVHH